MLEEQFYLKSPLFSQFTNGPKLIPFIILLLPFDMGHIKQVSVVNQEIKLLPPHHKSALLLT